MGPDNRARLTLAALAVVLAGGGLWAARGASPPVAAQAPSAARARAADARDLVDVLGRLVEIPTDPSHGTAAAAALVAATLRDAGVPDVQVLGPRPDRANVVARVRGSGKRPPLLLLAHLDVVAADRSTWRTDPWKLTREGDYYYGRGVLDDKGMAAILVWTVAGLVRDRVTLDRDVIVAFTADEEEGDDNGVAWLLEHHPDAIRAALCLTEGGGGDIRKGKKIANLVQVAEKVEQSFDLEVRDAGGDSAQPSRENAIVRLARAVERVSRVSFPLRTGDVTRDYFAAIAAREEPALAADLRAVGRGEGGDALARVAAASTWYAAMLHTTCEATSIAGGHGEGAMPTRARATVNCRVLPDGSADGGVAEVERAIVRAVDDPAVSVKRKWRAIAPPPSPRDATLFAAVAASTREVWPDVVVAPSLLPAATDGKYLRGAGIPTYGVTGIFEDVDDVREHGDDERVGAREIDEASRFFSALVRRLAAR
ncbi:MAG: M20/M25/M40 family metallo-hydrolase [Myxococcales bacterium]|nr:M20/M25/M40 family metallo-hydrolase [Myxococcales bacterium]